MIISSIRQYCQTSDLGLRLEVYFVFDLSQEEQKQGQEPHQNLPDRIKLKVWNLAHRLKETRLRSKTSQKILGPQNFRVQKIYC